MDDALILIGKSFYYQAEYLKAERKFAELLAQYPNSSLVLETQLWYGRTEEKLGKFEECIRLSEATISAAQTSRDVEIEAQAHQLLGSLYRRMKQNDKAVIEYEKVVTLSADEESKADAQISLGDIYFSNKQYDKAAEAYLRTEEFSSDIYLNYYSKLQASIAYREIGEYIKGLNLIDIMIEDFRNKEHLSALLFERANNYLASGKRDDAIGEYIFIDTTYAHSEYATRSAYQLGLLYEKEFGEYPLALKYFTEVNSATGLNIVADGHQKFTTLTRYFNARKRLVAADSLLVVVMDTTRKKTLDTLAVTGADTVQHRVNQVVSQSVAGIDSLKESKSIIDTTQRKGAQVVTQPALSKIDSLKGSKSIIDTAQGKGAQVVTQPAISNADSLKASESISDTTKGKDVQVTSQPILPSADSIKVLKSIAAQELGDIFYSEIVIPDSAFYWYNNSLTWNDNPNRSQRILYILAELSRVNPEKKFPAPEEYHKRLDRDYPESIYAEEARRFLGKTSSENKVDTAAEYYERSEKQIDTKQYKKAIKTLRTIVNSFPKSPLAAKSEYAIGWILENHLAQPESALVEYKHVVKNYEGTTYAHAAVNQIEGALQAEAAKLDSAKRIAAKLDSAKIDTAKTDTSKINATSIDTTKITTTKIDTSKINTASMDTSKITATKVDSSKINAVKKDTSKIKPAKIDTSKIKSTKIDTSKIKSTSVDVSKIKSTKADTSKVKTIKIDTSKSKNEKKDISKIKTTKIDTSGINRSQMNQKLPNPMDARKNAVVDSVKKVVK